MSQEALLKVSRCNHTPYLAERSIVKNSIKNHHPPFPPVEGWRVSPLNKKWNWIIAGILLDTIHKTISSHRTIHKTPYCRIICAVLRWKGKGDSKVKKSKSKPKQSKNYVMSKE